jgi:hypothetical protein
MPPSQTRRRGPTEPFAVWNTATEFVTVGLYFFHLRFCLRNKIHSLEYGVSEPNIAPR